jgi:formate transporter
MAGSTSGFGTTRFIGGIVFGLGLTMVMVGGGELFTSNNLISMAWASRQVTIGRLAVNWVVVYVGNLVSVVSVAVLLWAGGAYQGGDSAFAAEALRTAAGKSGRLFHQDIALGVLGNALVCLAVWLCFSARTTTDRILSCLLPMTALIVLGVDHVVANLHYFAAGLLLRGDAAAVEAAGLDAAALAELSLSGIAGNIAGVTIGNIIGGSVLVAAVYWFVYLRAGEVPADGADETVVPG